MSVILLAGASARAAAASALRAGLSPWCVDLFADADLARACPVMKLPIDRYPHGFLDALAEGPPGPWQYTGGLENHPDLIDAIPRQLLGNSGNVVRAVRGALTTIFGPTAPRECHAGTPSPTVTWLSKPRRGSGGLGVRRWQPGDPFDARTHFLQEFIEGVACSAVYVDERFLGATRQLIGPSWLRAPRPFQYAGSIGPLPLSDANDATLRSWGDCLVKKFHLRGIFGVDFMLTPTGCRPIEVNPRYPASTEILERRFSPRPLYSGGEGLGVRGSESLAVVHCSARDYFPPSPQPLKCYRIFWRCKSLRKKRLRGTFTQFDVGYPPVGDDT